MGKSAFSFKWSVDGDGSSAPVMVCGRGLVGCDCVNLPNIIFSLDRTPVVHPNVDLIFPNPLEYAFPKNPLCYRPYIHFNTWSNCPANGIYFHDH